MIECNNSEALKIGLALAVAKSYFAAGKTTSGNSCGLKEVLYKTSPKALTKYGKFSLKSLQLNKLHLYQLLNKIDHLIIRFLC